MTNTKTYAGSFVYSGSTLEYALFDEGRLVDNAGSFRYEYFLKDHLGNTRIVFKNNSGNKILLQRDEYYPFGLTAEQYTSISNQYKYNGKELQEDHGLNWYDYGARFYDAQIGRFHTMDPHADSYFSIAPYSSFANNPISFIDPTGEDIRFWQWQEDNELTAGGFWKQVVYDQLSMEVQKGLETFAKTKSGFSFFSKFANKGDKIGSVEFGATGEYANHNLNFGEYEGDYYADEGGTPFPINRNTLGPMQEGKTNAYIDFYLNINRNMENGKINIPETIGHEAFIHLSQYLDDYIKAFEANDLKGAQAILKKHDDGNPSGARDHLSMYYRTEKASKYYTFINQLKSVFNPKEVQDHVNKERIKLFDHARSLLKESERKGY